MRFASTMVVFQNKSYAACSGLSWRPATSRTFLRLLGQCPHGALLPMALWPPCLEAWADHLAPWAPWASTLLQWAPSPLVAPEVSHHIPGP